MNLRQCFHSNQESSMKPSTDFSLGAGVQRQSKASQAARDSAPPYMLLVYIDVTTVKDSSSVKNLT